LEVEIENSPPCINPLLIFLTGNKPNNSRPTWFGNKKEHKYILNGIAVKLIRIYEFPAKGALIL
jgi:hypothetical protein